MNNSKTMASTGLFLLTAISSAGLLQPPGREAGGRFGVLERMLADIKASAAEQAAVTRAAG